MVISPTNTAEIESAADATVHPKVVANDAVRMQKPSIA